MTFSWWSGGDLGLPTACSNFNLFSLSDCGSPQHLKNVKSVLEESFLSSICPGCLAGSGDFLSRTDRKFVLSQTPQKLQSAPQTPIISPNPQKIILLLFLSLAPLWPFSPVLNECRLPTVQTSPIIQLKRVQRATRVLRGLWNITYEETAKEFLFS